MPPVIRRAQAADIPAMLDLAEQRRTQYARYQPRYWNPAAGARLGQARYFAQLVETAEVLVPVCVQDLQFWGFLIARLTPAPPVYDPGGLTCQIDDFCLASPDTWQTVGKQLLEHTSEEARHRGASQVVVVCGHLDQPKRDMLFSTGATLASEWFVQSL